MIYFFWKETGDELLSFIEDLSKKHPFIKFDFKFSKIEFLDMTKNSEDDLKIKLCGKSVKYLGVKVDINLSCQYYVKDLSIKLNRANSLLSKIRKYLSLKTSRSIYFAIFGSYLSYCCLVLAQNCSAIQRIAVLQKRLLELLIFNQIISISVPY